MDSSLNFLENGGTEGSRACFQVRFMAIFVFHGFGLWLYRGIYVYISISIYIYMYTHPGREIVRTHEKQKRS